MSGGHNAMATLVYTHVEALCPRVEASANRNIPRIQLPITCPDIVQSSSSTRARTLTGLAWTPRAIIRAAHTVCTDRAVHTVCTYRVVHTVWYMPCGTYRATPASGRQRATALCELLIHKHDLSKSHKACTPVLEGWDINVGSW